MFLFEEFIYIIMYLYYNLFCSEYFLHKANMITLLILKIMSLLFLAVLIPAYWKTYGLQNFLWLSDISLFLTIAAIWFNSPLIMSTAIGILPVEMVWIVDYLYQLTTGRNLLGVTNYMFDPKYSRFLKNLSLFHLVIPVIWVIYLFNYGYNTNALLYQSLVIWIVLPLTYFFTDPKENINWVFVPQSLNWQWMPSWLWLLVLLVGFPLLIFLPCHFIYMWIFN
jgi:hypothetical protein